MGDYKALSNAIHFAEDLEANISTRKKQNQDNIIVIAKLERTLLEKKHQDYQGGPGMSDNLKFEQALFREVKSLEADLEAKESLLRSMKVAAIEWTRIAAQLNIFFPEDYKINLLPQDIDRLLKASSKNVPDVTREDMNQKKLLVENAGSVKSLKVMPGTSSKIPNINSKKKNQTQLFLNKTSTIPVLNKSLRTPESIYKNIILYRVQAGNNVCKALVGHVLCNENCGPEFRDLKLHNVNSTHFPQSWKHRFRVCGFPGCVVIIRNDGYANHKGTHAGGENVDWDDDSYCIRPRQRTRSQD